MDSRNSLALNNLRSIVVLVVVGFHAASAYLGSLPPAAHAFDKAPYLWTAFPIVDAHRWIGFDLICAWQDVYLMCLMFFLSALFSWPSLERKGTAHFLADRLSRLGIPYLFGCAIVMPIALYPVYKESAAVGSVGAYLRHLFALPFWPNGPMWFLGQLLVLSFLAAGVHRFAPGSVLRLARSSSDADRRPFRYFAAILAASLLAYVPLALFFTPFAWIDRGPVSFQLCRPLIYAVAYFAGLAAGVGGTKCGLLAPSGQLAKRWSIWFAGALVSYGLWIVFAAFSLHGGPQSPLLLQLLMDFSYALACTAGWFGVLALFLRFGAVSSGFLTLLAANAFGIYVLHYPFVVWLQYALLHVDIFAIAKGAIVFAGSLVLSLATLRLLRLVPFGLSLVGGERGRPTFATEPAWIGSRPTAPGDSARAERLSHTVR
ncbi:MAG TPA: acyltransferase [Rhizomicrobium sp.]|nr:acyltransferase [Rhizomicrobium sp.]